MAMAFFPESAIGNCIYISTFNDTISTFRQCVLEITPNLFVAVSRQKRHEIGNPQTGTSVQLAGRGESGCPRFQRMCCVAAPTKANAPASKTYTSVVSIAPTRNATVPIRP